MIKHFSLVNVFIFKCNLKLAFKNIYFLLLHLTIYIKTLIQLTILYVYNYTYLFEKTFHWLMYKQAGKYLAKKNISLLLMLNH